MKINSFFINKSHTWTNLKANIYIFFLPSTKYSKHKNKIHVGLSVFRQLYRFDTFLAFLLNK